MSIQREDGNLHPAWSLFSHLWTDLCQEAYDTALYLQTGWEFGPSLLLQRVFKKSFQI